MALGRHAGRAQLLAPAVYLQGAKGLCVLERSLADARERVRQPARERAREREDGGKTG
jgi:hypothetical protein